MYGPQPLNFTLIAAAVTPQYRFVLGSGENLGGQAVNATQMNLGIAQNSAGVNEHIAVCALGESRCYVNSAVTAYAYVTATASGGATVAVSGDTINGIAIEAGAIGDLIRVFVTPPWHF
jgi:hypothetical protein